MMREILFRGKRKDNGEWFVDELHDTEYPTVYFDTEENAEKALKILNKEIKNYE